MSEEREVDIDIRAYPSQNVANVISQSADGMIFIKRRFDNSQEVIVKGEEVNDLLAGIKEACLKCSFKLAE